MSNYAVSQLSNLEKAEVINVMRKETGADLIRSLCLSYLVEKNEVNRVELLNEIHKETQKIQKATLEVLQCA